MADSVGSISLIRLDGPLAKPSYELETITLPGVDGVAYRRMGRRVQPLTCQGVVDVADAAGIDLLYATVAGLVATSVSVVQAGVTFSSVLVLAAKVVGVQPIVSSRGGVLGAGATRLATIEFVLQVTQ